MLKKCVYCGTEIEDNTTNSRRQFCNDNCRHRYKRYGSLIDEKKAKKFNENQKEGEMPKKLYSVESVVNEVLSHINKKTIQPLPPIKVSKIKCGKGDDEEVVLKLSDWQLGHKTISFNYEIAKDRAEYLLEKVLKIVNLHRTSAPIKVINIFLEGDFIQSDKVDYLIDQSELEGILIDQVYEQAVPLLVWFISEIAKYFEKVNVYCVRGNHGRGEKGSSEKNNWDDVIYKTLNVYFLNSPSVSFHIAREFYQLADILGWKFLITHGDQVRGGSYNIPLYALLQRMLRWATSMPFQWDVLSVGHWHSYAHIEQNQQELVVNGTLVSDDEFVRKSYGWNASTSQTLFGVHKRHKIAWMRKIDLLVVK